MISDQQRREVAAALRDEAEAWRTDNGDDTVYSMSDDTFTESVLTAFGFDDMEMSAYRIFDKIADLIDLPTCSIKRGARNQTAWGVCSRCAALVNAERAMSDATEYLPTRYCPACGAEVTDDE